MVTTEMCSMETIVNMSHRSQMCPLQTSCSTTKDSVRGCRGGGSLFHQPRVVMHMGLDLEASLETSIQGRACNST
jgi:hypothetical protein